MSTYESGPTGTASEAAEPKPRIQVLKVDGSRPAVARVAALPREYRLTDAEWRVLMILACDSFDGETSAPGLENMAAWTGLLRSSVSAAMTRLCEPTEDRPALLARHYSTRGRNRTEWRLLLPQPSGSPTVHEPSTNRPAEPDGKPSTNRPVTPDTPFSPKDPFPPATPPASGGGHPHEPNARAALERLIGERQLPLDVDELLQAAYKLGDGDPWAGYLHGVKPETEQSLDTARDPAAVLRQRLGIARRGRRSVSAPGPAPVSAWDRLPNITELRLAGRL